MFGFLLIGDCFLNTDFQSLDGASAGSGQQPVHHVTARLWPKVGKHEH